jgi:molybdenum cofactor cytidylyltransferase
MLSSILVGLEELASEEVAASDDPIVIAPADLPTLSAESVRALLRAFRHLRPKLALPTFRGKRGHPLLIARSLIPDLHRLDPKIGLKQILDTTHRVLEVELDDPGIALDVDTPEDYERLKGSSPGNGR